MLVYSSSRKHDVAAGVKNQEHINLKLEPFSDNIKSHEKM